MLGVPEHVDGPVSVRRDGAVPIEVIGFAVQVSLGLKGLTVFGQTGVK